MYVKYYVKNIKTRLDIWPMYFSRRVITSLSYYACFNLIYISKSCDLEIYTSDILSLKIPLLSLFFFSYSNS